MKITNSSVAMAAVHQEFSYTHKDSASIEVQASKNLPAAILSLSGEAEGKSYMASLQEYQDEQKEKEAQRQKENEEKSRKLIADQLQKSPKVSKGTGRLEMSDEYKMKLEMIKQLFAMLRNGIEIKGTDVNNLNHEGGVRSALCVLSQTGGKLLKCCSFSIRVGCLYGFGADWNKCLWNNLAESNGHKRVYQ